METQSEFQTDYPELELAKKLSQLEGGLSFLNYLNNELENAPRNTTERETIKTNLGRIKEVRQLFKTVLNKNYRGHV